VQKVAAETRSLHHHTTVETDSHAHRELSEIEKVKLFQDFERWNATKSPVKPAAPSLAEIAEPPHQSWIFSNAGGRDPGSQKAPETILTLTKQAEYGLPYAPDTIPVRAIIR
jgi:hypothetical protein